MTAHPEAQDYLRMVRCDECGEPCYEIELVDGVCIDCYMTQRRVTTRKNEGEKDDDRKQHANGSS